jgi:hypothetical protein
LIFGIPKIVGTEDFYIVQIWKKISHWSWVNFAFGLD